MSESYKDLIKQRELLEQKISEARQRELADAIARVRGIVAEYDLSSNDVFPAGRGARVATAPAAKVAPKYRDPATGQTWTGRGKPPRWIQNQDRTQFAI